jgi:restriction system protein
MIPDYQTLMEPVLRAAANGEVRINDVVEILSDKFKLTGNERAELLPSGKQTVIANRVHWAKTYLKQAGLVEPTKRGHFQITERGKDVLSRPNVRIDNSLLKSFDEFREFQTRSSVDGTSSLADVQVATRTSTPEEVMRAAYDEITASVASELVYRLRSGTPAFFERTIVNLLLAMGYGGSSSDAGRAIGQSGDDGVDGVIDQDPLGVDQIYVQAKRYAENNTIGSAAIREFYGSLSLKKAQKGIFVTTSSFTRNAVETARQIGARMVLIDAEHLGRLLVRYNVGCRDQEVLHIKRIDEDFFE